MAIRTVCTRCLAIGVQAYAADAACLECGGKLSDDLYLRLLAGQLSALRTVRQLVNLLVWLIFAGGFVVLLLGLIAMAFTGRR